MSRDIDQEVSDTLCTLLSFDEDNFLSQEEVEENLRNCSYIGNVSTLQEKSYEDNAATTSGNTRLNDSSGSVVDVAKYECALEEEEQSEMIQRLEDVSMDESKNDRNTLYTHDDDIPASLEATSKPLNTIITNDSPNNKEINEIKTEIICEPEQITEDYLPPPQQPQSPPPQQPQSPPPQLPPPLIESMQEDLAGDTNCKMSDSEIDIKLEFTCESEKMTDEKLENDYFIEDEFKKDINFNYGLTQVEIGCLNESVERDDEDLPNDLLLNESLLSQNSEQSIVSDDKDVCDIEDDRELCNVMSDHNYTWQEKTPNKENLQKLLLNHILQSKGSSVSIKVVTDFVEKTLESISLFGIDNDIKPGFNDVKAKVSIEKVDIFADGKSKKGAIFDEELGRLAAIEETGDESTYDEKVKEEGIKVFEDQAAENYTISQTDMIFTNVSLSSIVSPLANCSEPMEHVLPDKSVKSDTDRINIDGIEFKSMVDETESSISESSNAEKTKMESNEITPNETTAQEVVTTTEAKAAQEAITTQTITERTQGDITTETANEDDATTLEHISSTVILDNDETKEIIQMDTEDAEPAELPTVQEMMVDEKPAKIAIFNKELGQMALKESEGILEDLNRIEGLHGDEEASTNITVSENKCIKSNDVFKAINIASLPSPAEYCSEPLEHTTFDEAFDLNCNEKLTVINHLDTLKSFAKALREDCETFTSSTTTIECKLQKYMQEKLEIFKKIVKSAVQIRYEDKSIQTDESLPKRKIRKLNQNNKKMLLQPTDSSASTSELSSSSDNEHSIKSQQKSRPNIKRTSNNNAQHDDHEVAATQINRGTKKEENIAGVAAADYDDGVALVDYTQSEVFETETFCNDTFSNIKTLNKRDSGSSDSESGKSDVEYTWHDKKSNTVAATNKGSPNESDKENSAGKTINNSKSTSQNEGDKEIERLINLNGLIKRTNLGTAKSAESKAKTKAMNSKNKDIIDTFTDDDIQAEIFSDPSISESEEEIITEKQFLKRCNENVKKLLLSDSNSDATDSDITDDIEEILSSNEGSRSNSPLVDRFLKNFNANDSDDEESEKCDNANSSSVQQQQPDAYDLKIDKNKSISSDNSDCEMLDGSGGDMMINPTASTKHSSKSKSLEKMLSVVEKRKKMNRLCDSISLSSESESSDVEEVEEEKSSRIKPMLRPEQLATVTREAQRNESERIRRLEKKHKTLAKLLKERPDVQEDCNLILDYNEETKTFIKVHPDIVKHLKQHQREGVRFMYDSCYGGIEALKKSSGSGCILAHCMGLGKTLQLIALLHTVISYKELKTSKVLVLCPKSTVMNWADEIDRWLGPLKPKYYTFNDTSDVNDKIQILKDWSASTPNAAGILLIGYEAFRTLVFYHSYKNRGIAQSRLDSIRNDVDKYLLSPGADLVVCDEGHIIKNSKSAISLAVSQIKTPKRIVLTGTPIQNNLKEYYSMVNFIKPLFLGTEKEFANLYANPIKNGQHKDSSKRDIQVMKQRSFVLHKKLSKFVQRKEAELLKTFLPQKYEYVLFIPMTKVQTILYEHILAIISKKEERGKGLITDYTCLRKIWTHPKVLEDAWINATAQKHRKDSRKQQAVHSDDDQPDDVYDSQTGVISVTNDWWRNLLSEKDLETILPSNKLRTMFEILRMCEEKGEKCLIFSAFVAVLNVVEYFFKKMNDKDPDTLNELKMSQGYQVKNTWILGKDYYRLDGKTPKLIRHEMIEQFNSVTNKRARVFLISSRAGGQGINLTGANRVIILDTSWNPSNDQQNIFRVFRLGQKKNCYIYRLIAMGTMEEKVYSRSVTKQAMSFRVVDIQQIDRHYSMAELTELYSLTNPDYENRPMPDCPQDSILACLLLNYPSLVYKYHEHDSLLENKVEQELSEQEKQDAWAAYERDQQINSEIREMPNPDELQNSLSAPKFPPYLGSSLSAFNQMSALFNYGNYPPASLSPYLPYLSHLNNYSASNQQYLEMRKRLAEGTFPYPDISTSLGQTPFSTPFGQNPPKPISTSPLIPDLPLHTNPLHANPLSALGDLSMFGLGSAAAAAAANNHMQQQQQQQQRQHGSPTYAAAAAAAAATNASNAAAANFDYQMYENSLKSLMNYRHDFSAGSSNTMNKSSKGGSNNNMPSTVNQFKNPLYSAQMSNVNYDKNTMPPPLSSPTPPKSIEQQQQQQQAQKQQYGADKNAAGKTSTSAQDVSTRNDPNANVNKSNYGNMGNSSGARNSPLPTAQVSNNNNNSNKRTYINDVNITNITSATAAAANNAGDERFTTKQKTTKDTMSNYQSYNKINTNAGNNSGGGNSSIYSNKNAATSKTSNDGMNNNKNSNNNKSSMQIIPTTSPPGTTSITKQFTDISPSISLTAVTTTSNNNNQKNLMKNTNNNMKMSTNSSSNKPELTKASTPYPTNKFFEMHKRTSTNRTVPSKTNLLPTNSKSSISTEPISKSSTRTPTPTPKTSSLSSTQNSYQQKNSNANEIGSKLLSAVVTTTGNSSSTSARNAKNVLHKKLQNSNLTVQQIKTSNTNVRTTPTPASKATSTITAVKSPQNGPTKSTTLMKPTLSSQQQSEFRKTPVSMEKKRASPIVTKAMQQSSTSASASASSSSGKAQKSPTASSTSSSSSGALKIQANSANKSSASASSTSTNENMLTYILETCINQKKFAIGAPTKGGGGTTVTRVQTQGKRKNPENIPKDAGSNEPKRAK